MADTHRYQWTSGGSLIGTALFGGVLVLVGLGLAAGARNERAKRDSGAAPVFPAWFSGGWMERHPKAVAVQGYAVAVVGAVILLAVAVSWTASLLRN